MVFQTVRKGGDLLFGTVALAAGKIGVHRLLHLVDRLVQGFSFCGKARNFLARYDPFPVFVLCYGEFFHVSSSHTAVLR